MNNTTLVENTINELTYAESILNMIVDNDIKADGSLFNSIESVVENISRAKKNVCNISADENKKSIGDILITKNENLEGAIGSILSVLEMAINLSASNEPSNKNGNQVSIINLIFTAKLNLETVYEKISFN
ncbi:hypothetical protein [Providencia heimbachae]|uniref:Uncharacterized protein n=1 Tax=Providencia heimbachae ATCC 35613 TaxID=1354272 RepID=A0A1B7K1I4_9GAMM|nr:hypothetical protein [Providencia heimbachae]OAT54013.1 hypothetical protein M998_0694 [Providencia heimbachae ATCC 35613]SQH13752.1 Uncharacterised protein [Providencia heimbachae]